MANADALVPAVQEGDKASPNYQQRRRTNRNAETGDVRDADDKLTGMDLKDDIRRENTERRRKAIYDNPRSKKDD